MAEKENKQADFFPKVSIVVAVFNAETVIEACLESLLACEYPPGKKEIIVINNASTDGTAEILKKYEPGIRILFETKQGPAAARNCGIKNATGEIIALTDADCIVDSNWVSQIIQPLKDTQIGISGGKILSRQPCNTIEKFGEKIHNHEAAITGYKHPYVITMNWAARRLLIKKIGFFNEAFLRGSDSEFSLRVEQASYGFAYAPESIIYHQNEKKLSGLFSEGCIHGFYSNKIIKTHQQFFAKNGHRRFNGKSYTDIISSLKKIVLGINRKETICHFTFNVGKK